MDKHHQCLKTCTCFKEFGRKIMKSSCQSGYPELTGEQSTALRYFTYQVAGDVVKRGMLAFEEMLLDWRTK